MKRLMRALSRHGRRVAVSLLPLLLGVLHVLGLLPLDSLQRLDDQIYDARLRWTMPATLDERVVIVDIDEQSLAEVGRWPWPRNRVADLVDALFDRHQIALLGMDTVFAEPDGSSGLPQLERLAREDLKDLPEFSSALTRLRQGLDHDLRLADALRGRPVVMGFYFSNESGGRTFGALPEPVLRRADLQGRALQATQWTGYGANLPGLASAAPLAGFFNAVPGDDGMVRSLPLLVEHGGAYYESLSLAMFRTITGMPTVEPRYPPQPAVGGRYDLPRSIALRKEGGTLEIPVDERVAVLVPFRGPGGPQGGSFRYVSASDVLANRVVSDLLKGRIVLLGTTAPGLLDLRATPVGEAYPGVETHANVLTALMDGRLVARPDYAAGYELVVLLLAGLVLAFGLPVVGATGAVALSLAVFAAVVGLNTWLYLAHGLALPMASTLVMAGLTFVINMSYGYLVESRAKRELAQLFGTYVPPELVDEMVKDPDSYSMEASTRELTVLFCDMRGFTAIAESMTPTGLQSLLNTVFSRLTRVIRHHRGTIDKYMGDCVMAFWGAPVDTRGHAALAVQAALDMAAEITTINRERQAANQPAIGVGIGLNTGDMCVGDMGSDVRRSYTVVGDAVNLGARLEGLTRVYGVDVVASGSTRQQAPDFVWQELDRVRVKGKAQAVDIHTPLCAGDQMTPELSDELKEWEQALQAWRQQNWDRCLAHLEKLQRKNAKKVLYRLYAERVVSMRIEPPPPDWDGSTAFDTK